MKNNENKTSNNSLILFGAGLSIGLLAGLTIGGTVSHKKRLDLESQINKMQTIINNLQLKNDELTIKTTPHLSVAEMLKRLQLDEEEREAE